MKKPLEVPALLTQLAAETGTAFESSSAATLQEAYEKAHANQSSVAIKVLTIAGGILANLFFLGFLFVANLLDSPWTLLSLGLLCVIGSIILSRKFDLLILDSLAVTTFASGICMLGIGLEEVRLNDKGIFCILLVVSLVSLLVIENYILAFVAAISVSCNFFGLIFETHSRFWMPFFTMLVIVSLTAWVKKEAALITFNRRLAILHSPVRLALICTLLAATFFQQPAFYRFSGYLNLMPALATVGAILYLLPGILHSLNIHQARTRSVAGVGVTLVLLPTLFAPTISCGLLVLVLGFSIRDRVGLVLGILGLIFFTCRFYYDLHLSLLIKSLILMGSGILLLALYFLLHQYFLRHEKI